jgi:hypothetical protein
MSSTSTLNPKHWLVLVYQIPAKPAYSRVKIHRRLKAIGAVAVKNSVSALPDNDESREDFQWLKTEIEEIGGEAILVQASLIAGLTDQALKQMFNEARSLDYYSLADEARNELDAAQHDNNAENRQSTIRKLRNRLNDIAEMDFFGADGREAANGLLVQLESIHLEDVALQSGISHHSGIGGENLKNRTWVTRAGVRVDRIASAWLIKRFIDPGSTFKYVPATGYSPVEGELRFDMFEAEFTHEGDQCTFEVLLKLAGPENQALRAIADIIHDLDLKDSKYGRVEAQGVKSLIDGICLANADDDRRIARGSAALEDLYSYFQQASNR